MKRLPERFDELQRQCQYKLKPVSDQEAEAVRAECSRSGIPVEQDAPVGTNDHVLIYAVLGVKGVTYLTR